jgi:multidrug efflux system membrane fusion protein
VRLIGREQQDSVLIEDRAVGTDLSKKFVLTLTTGNRVEYRLVELGPEIDGLRVVTHGLAPNDVIVINGLQHVRPGQTVAPTRVAMSDNSDGLTQVAAQTSSEPKVSPVVVVGRVAQAAVARRSVH